MTQPPVPPPSGGFPPPGFGVPQPAANYPPVGYPAAPAYQLPKEAYTPWITRVAAYFIDMLPVLLLTGIGQAVMAFTATREPCRSFDGAQCIYVAPTAFGVVTALVLSLAALAFAIWNLGYRQGSTGSSVGKSVMKFAVVSERTGRPIGFWPSLGRQLAHLLDSVFCSIGYLWPLWDAKRQTFADKIMATVCLPIRKDSQ